MEETVKTSYIYDLIKIADLLDASGYFDVANKVDLAIRLLSNNNKAVKLADYFDESGFTKIANIIDEINQIEEYGFFPKVRESEEEEAPIKPLDKISLSSRYCPDHRGVQAIRLDDQTYQCPIDGKMYNYETGYTDYDGQRVPGGSIAAQTPTTSNYGGIPIQVYDSRSNVLNRIN